MCWVVCARFAATMSTWAVKILVMWSFSLMYVLMVVPYLGSMRSLSSCASRRHLAPASVLGLGQV